MELGGQASGSSQSKHNMAHCSTAHVGQIDGLPGSNNNTVKGQNVKTSPSLVSHGEQKMCSARRTSTHEIGHFQVPLGGVVE